MSRPKISNSYTRCIYKEECCFRSREGWCRILHDTAFADGECHFRKIWKDGVNEYDKARGVIRDV